MKRIWTIIILTLSFSILTSHVCHAQAFKGFGKKIEAKLNKKLEDKANRHLDKNIHAVDSKSDETIEKTLNGSSEKSYKREATNKRSTNTKSIIDSREGSDPVLEVRKDQSMTMIGPNACKEFLWFKKGTAFEYAHESSASSKKETSRMQVNGVSQYNGETIADISTSQNTTEGNIEINLRYVCDANNFYMDMSSMYEQIMQQLSGGETSSIKDALDSSRVDISEGYTAIPKVLYPGLELPDASFSFTMHSSGIEMTMNSELSQRVVVAREKVTTEAGTFDSMKIQAITSTKIQVMGRTQDAGQSVSYVWIAPEVGMVKQEIYTNNKLDYKMTLSKVEK